MLFNVLPTYCVLIFYKVNIARCPCNVILQMNFLQFQGLNCKFDFNNRKSWFNNIKQKEILHTKKRNVKIPATCSNTHVVSELLAT